MAQCFYGKIDQWFFNIALKYVDLDFPMRFYIYGLFLFSPSPNCFLHASDESCLHFAKSNKASIRIWTWTYRSWLLIRRQTSYFQNQFEASICFLQIIGFCLRCTALINSLEICVLFFWEIYSPCEDQKTSNSCQFIAWTSVVTTVLTILKEEVRSSLTFNISEMLEYAD